jgi:integrase-like protein
LSTADQSGAAAGIPPRVLAQVVSLTVIPQTRANYKTNLQVHIIPALGSLKLQRLTAPRIASFYSELLADGRRDGEGLAPKTVRNIHALLHRAGGRIAQAVEDRDALGRPQDHVKGRHRAFAVGPAEELLGVRVAALEHAPDAAPGCFALQPEAGGAGAVPPAWGLAVAG